NLLGGDIGSGEVHPRESAGVAIKGHEAGAVDRNRSSPNHWDCSGRRRAEGGRFSDGANRTAFAFVNPVEHRPGTWITSQSRKDYHTGVVDERVFKVKKPIAGVGHAVGLGTGRVASEKC